MNGMALVGVVLAASLLVACAENDFARAASDWCRRSPQECDYYGSDPVPVEDLEPEPHVTRLQQTGSFND